jgi:hypothetical protein
MLRTALILAAGVAVAGEPKEIVGTWRADALPGVTTIDQLTFTTDGRLLAGKNQLLGRYVVDGRRVVARSAQITYPYELMDDGRLCISPGPSLMPLAKASGGEPARGQCYRKSKEG